jgi:Spy/CpxP family protein refolding chaperone
MKKLGILFMILILGTTVSMAQNRGGGQGQGNYDPVKIAKKQTANLKEVLGLSGDQETKVYEILLKGANKIAEMREEMRSGNGSREEMRANFTKLRKEQSQEMKKVLTEEQYKKYEKYLEGKRAQRGRGQGKG